MDDGFDTPQNTCDERTGVVWRRRRADGLKIPTLRVVAGPDLLASYAIYPAERVLIGRDAECDLMLTDSSVSRRHAVVEWQDGELFLEDLESTNGTALGRQEVKGRIGLTLGQVFYVGNVALRIDAMSIEEIQHLERVTDRLSLVTRDALTGLLARAWMDEELDALVARHRTRGSRMAAIFVDVDHFKKVNDTFGHALGDQVLRVVANLLVAGVRESDKVVRYGGEEFVVILTDCQKDDALLVADRLRRSIERHRWESYAPDSEEPLVVTASLGVALLGDGETESAWLERADVAMYRAKRRGRNRVVAAPVND